MKEFKFARKKVEKKDTRSETNALVGGIEHGVETLEECVSVDEVETLARVGAPVGDNLGGIVFSIFGRCASGRDEFTR